MPTKKRNLVDFMETASMNREVLKTFLAVLNKKKVTPEELHAYFQSQGYEAVSLKVCKTLVLIRQNRGPLKPGALERAY